MNFDGATVLYQWATGGLLFLWVTTRRREVGLGYGWLMRGVFLVMTLGAVALGLRSEFVPLRDGTGVGLAVCLFAVLTVSISRRRAGVEGQRRQQERRSARVAAMTGIDRAELQLNDSAAEFDPRLDLIPVAVGTVVLVASVADVGGPVWLSALRIFCGALFLGCATDAMLLGHWYLVQPGLPRDAIHELNNWLMKIWFVEVVVFLLPTGMFSVFSGTIDDGYNGLLGWFWIACALATGILSVVTRLALREREYSAVMAATGLLYLAILTAFGTDLVARAILAGA